MKPYIPEIRVISVDHDRTSLAAGRLRHFLDAQGLSGCPVRSVFCHLESGRCGVKAGIVAVEVDGRIVWAGKELTENMAEQFCSQLHGYIVKQTQNYGAADK